MNDVRDSIGPEAIKQPKHMRQSVVRARQMRRRWCAPPTQIARFYLIMQGRRVRVKFPTVCFDEEPRLRADAVLPRKEWLNNVCSSFFSMLKNITRGAFDNINKGTFLDRKRWYALWAHGNFRVCASKRNTSFVSSIVLHWDGCNSSAQAYSILRKRGLSAHLLLDADGTVYQMLDIVTDKGFHAGAMNECSVGIEICNPVDPEYGDGAGRKLVELEIPRLGVKSVYWDFTEQQKKCVVDLVDFLTENLGIPKIIPSFLPHEGGCLDASFQGICGHYHVSKHKVDPGLSLWATLIDSWRGQSSGLAPRT